MHIIGFSHHYEKMRGQTHGILLSVRSTKPIGHRPDKTGITYDTVYMNPEYIKWRMGKLHLKARECLDTWCYYPLNNDDFEKPLLQLVFLGLDHQIPFTTYRKFPEDYKPFYSGVRTYRKKIPYSDLIGEVFAFKFKGEELPFGLSNKICTREGSHVEIYE